MADVVFKAATGGATSVRYIPESIFGTTPAVTAGNIFELRNKGCTLGVSKDSVTSNELRSDRMISDLRHGNIKVGGNLPIEFSFKEYDAFLEAAMFGTWNANVLKSFRTVKSFTMERFFSDLDTPYYSQFTGVMVDGFSLDVKPNDMVTGQFTLVGVTGAMSPTSLLTTGSPTASQTYSPFDSFTGTIKEGGSTISIVTSLSIDVKNNITPAYVIGQKSAGALPAGRSKITGSLTCFFNNVTMLNKFLNETESSVEFTLGDGVDESYTFLLPRIKYSSGQPDVNGEGQIELTMAYEALYDSTEATNMKITRTAT